MVSFNFLSKSGSATSAYPRTALAAYVASSATFLTIASLNSLFFTMSSSFRVRFSRTAADTVTLTLSSAASFTSVATMADSFLSTARVASSLSLFSANVFSLANAETFSVRFAAASTAREVISSILAIFSTSASHSSATAREFVRLSTTLASEVKTLFSPLPSGKPFRAALNPSVAVFALFTASCGSNSSRLRSDFAFAALTAARAIESFANRTLSTVGGVTTGSFGAGAAGKSFRALTTVLFGGIIAGAPFAAAAAGSFGLSAGGRDSLSSVTALNDKSSDRSVTLARTVSTAMRTALSAFSVAVIMFDNASFAVAVSAGLGIEPGSGVPPGSAAGTGAGEIGAPGVGPGLVAPQWQPSRTRPCSKEQRPTTTQRGAPSP
ncbi:hypothetical protein DQ04_19431000 [Trypanosoma grayi]|uniref:hypothetical protein n=1 Tax=Trypanosoma grayi TaxID=71804 RepID=UPI0004F417ED|nr:hypothetical protein DQ04_19431000 [Trypanosoma grayi]KEG05676.1 hypothetical protein DQ04_19431000 [Trypanosoma grayi]